MLLTASGAPGTAALARALRENGERRVRLVGTDMSDRAIGRHFCDAFALVPAGDDPGFANAVLEVCEREHVDAVVPQSSYELLVLAEAKPRFGETTVLVSSPEAVRVCDDKVLTYERLPRTPRFALATGGEALAAAAEELGYPDEDVAVKPRRSSGSRGFRVVSARADRRRQLLENRPGVAEALRLEELVELVGDLRLDHFFNIQLVGDVVIEVNPRISTIVYQEDLNLAYLGVKHALGEISAEELAAYEPRIRPTRRALRYFDQVEWDD